MKRFKPVTSRNMTDCLKRHPLYEAAEGVIKDKLPECVHNEVSFYTSSFIHSPCINDKYFCVELDPVRCVME